MRSPLGDCLQSCVCIRECVRMCAAFNMSTFGTFDLTHSPESRALRYGDDRRQLQRFAPTARAKVKIANDDAVIVRKYANETAAQLAQIRCE